MRTKLYKRIAMTAAVFASGMLGIGIALADIGTNEPIKADSEVGSTYDATLGVTMPVDIDQGLQAQAPVMTSDELSGEDPSWDDTSANTPNQPGAIVTVSNVGDAGMPSPLPESVLHPTNGYRFSDDHSSTYVWVGADGGDAANGLIVEVTQSDADSSNGDDGGGPVSIPDTGGITLTSVSGNILSFTDAHNDTGTYDLVTKAYTLTPCIGNPPGPGNGPGNQCQ